MRTKTTVKPEIKILRVLAHHREFEQYNLPKETNISYRTILRFLKPMEKADLIRLVRTEPSEKGGKDRKIYETTFSGLIRAIKPIAEKYDYAEEKVKKEIEETVDQIMAIHKGKFPLIFGKWNFFRENNVIDIIVKRFIRAVLGSNLPFYTHVLEITKQQLQNAKTGHPDKELEQFMNELHGETEGKKKFEELSQAMKGIDEALKNMHTCMHAYELRVSQGMRDLTNKTLGLFSVGFVDGQFKDEKNESMFLLQVLRKDSELKAYIENELNEIEREYTQYLANVKSWKQQFGISYS